MSQSHDFHNDDVQLRVDDAPQTPAPGRTSRTESLVQRKAEADPATANAGETYKSATSGAGSEVPHRAEMEAGFGTDFSNVKAHTGKSSEMNDLGAAAATLGIDNTVAFADSSPDKATVAHELAHVVQGRNAGAGGGVQTRSTVSQPSDAAEQQAETAAQTVADGGTVDASSLRAFGSGIMRKDVNVSAGRKKTETESTTRVEDQGNQFEDQLSVWTKLQAWKNGTSITFAVKSAGVFANVTRPPTNADALRFFYEATVGTRNKVYMDDGPTGVLTLMCKQFANADIMRVMGICDFPLYWKVRHWFKDVVNAAGDPRGLALKIIRNSPLAQRLEVCKSELCIDDLVKVLPKDDPENVFGDAIKAQLYPDETTKKAFDKAHPKFAKWRGDTAKLDAEARIAFIAASPVANIAALKADMLTSGPSNGKSKWDSLWEWGPRGLALTDSQRTNLDKAGKTAGISNADQARLFQMRFNSPLDHNSTPNAQVRIVWAELEKLPLSMVTSEMITKVTLNPASPPAGVAGAYNDFTHSGGFGSWWTLTSMSLSKVQHTVRHEVGHGADVQAGGFSNFSSKPPILWKKWMTSAPWLQEILKYMDATGGTDAAAWTAFITAAYNNAPFVSPLGAYTNTPGPDTPLQKAQKLWKRVEGKYNPANIKSALKLLKRHRKHTANPNTVRGIITHARGETYPGSKPSYLRDHYFVKKYGEHFAYHKDGANAAWALKGKHGISDYTLCSPYEYYADMFAAYYDTPTNRDANVPSAARGYFAALTKKYDKSAADDATASGLYDTTAMGNHKAAQDKTP